MKKVTVPDQIEARVVLDQDSAVNKQVATIAQAIKQMGIEVSRKDPSEWNQFMTACLSGLD